MSDNKLTEGRKKSHTFLTESVKVRLIKQIIEAENPKFFQKPLPQLSRYSAITKFQGFE